VVVQILERYIGTCCEGLGVLLDPGEGLGEGHNEGLGQPGRTVQVVNCPGIKLEIGIAIVFFYVLLKLVYLVGSEQGILCRTHLLQTTLHFVTHVQNELGQSVLAADAASHLLYHEPDGGLYVLGQTQVAPSYHA
jgi:hypothetical protein